MSFEGVVARPTEGKSGMPKYFQGTTLGDKHWKPGPPAGNLMVTWSRVPCPAKLHRTLGRDPKSTWTSRTFHGPTWRLRGLRF